MQQETDGEVVHLLEEVPALLFRLARLLHQRLPERVVTLNQVIIPLVEALQMLDDWDESEFPLFATIAGRTAENNGVSPGEFEETRRLKREDRGGFGERLLLMSVED